MRLVVLLLAGLLGSAVAAEPDRRADPERGVAVTRPAGWRFIDTPVAPGTDGARPRLGPVVTIKKHADGVVAINPNFSVSLKEFGDVPPGEAKWFFETTVESIMSMQGATLTAPVHEVSVGGRPGFHAAIDGAVTAPDGSEQVGSVEFWLVPAGDLYYLMAGSYPKADAAARAEFQSIVASLELGAGTTAK